MRPAIMAQKHSTSSSTLSVSLLVAIATSSVGCGNGLNVQLVDGAHARPSNVAMFFTVDDDEGEPVGGLAADSFVMVAGYPGRTQRLKTAAEAQQAADWYYTRQIALFEEHIAVLEGLAKDRPEIAIKSAARLRGLHNYLTNFKGVRDGLVKGGVAAEKARLEGELQKWIDADAGRTLLRLLPGFWWMYPWCLLPGLSSLCGWRVARTFR